MHHSSVRNYDVLGGAARRRHDSPGAQPCFLDRSCDLVRAEGSVIGVMKAEQGS